MIVYNGIKLTPRIVNLLYIDACKDANYARVVKAVEEFGADINCKDINNTNRALAWALKKCQGENSEGEKIVEYLLSKGVEVNFQIGKSVPQIKRPYAISLAVCNIPRVSNRLVYLLLKNGAIKDIYHGPVKVKNGEFKNCLEVIKLFRPSVYSKLLEEKLISEKKVK